MSGSGSRQLFIVGQMPEGDRPRLFKRQYRGVPQFDLAELDASQRFDGPQPHVHGRLYALPDRATTWPAIPVRACPYRSSTTIEPQPLPLPLHAAPVAPGTEDDHRVPLPRSVRARPDPSR